MLLIRAADWVEEVRAVAQQAIAQRLVPEYIPAFVQNLVLLEGESFASGRATALMPAIEGFLTSTQAAPRLASGVNQRDRGVRRAASR